MPTEIQIAGKTKCYDMCTIGHKCFGGYIHEEPMCDREIDRVYKLLIEEYGKNIMFAPKEKVGLRFTLREQVILSNIEGIWVEE